MHRHCDALCLHRICFREAMILRVDVAHCLGKCEGDERKGSDGELLADAKDGVNDRGEQGAKETIVCRQTTKYGVCKACKIRKMSIMMMRMSRMTGQRNRNEIYT